MNFTFPFFTSCNAVPGTGGWVPGARSWALGAVLMSEVRSQKTEEWLADCGVQRPASGFEYT